MKKNNNNLHQAKRAKNDEFYTQLTDIEKELKHKATYLVKDADGSINGKAKYARILIKSK